jgi:putative FmdB family regulatory protein
MPIYDIRCRNCGHTGEVLVTASAAALICPVCGASDTDKIMAATSSLTGRTRAPLPGPGDTGCCGSHPGQAGCAGPGSCCGKGTG